MELTKELSTEQLPPIKLKFKRASEKRLDNGLTFSKSNISQQQSQHSGGKVSSMKALEFQRSEVDVASLSFQSLHLQNSEDFLKNLPPSTLSLKPSKFGKGQQDASTIGGQPASNAGKSLSKQSFITALDDDDQTSEASRKDLIMDYYSMALKYDYDQDEDDGNEEFFEEELFSETTTAADFDSAVKQKGLKGKKYKNALFAKGQQCFETGAYDEAMEYFVLGMQAGDMRATFQLGVIHYDGLGSKNNLNYKLGVEYMTRVAQSDDKDARHIRFAALYNIGRAYFQGYGVRQSDEQAENYWLEAADRDGNPYASVKAMSTLGLYYSRDETRNLKKAFHWHAEASTRGSLESQGALGIMHLYGFGTKKDVDLAFTCLRHAAEKGNVYAMGLLISFYYQRKLFTKTAELAQRVSMFNDVAAVAKETDCMVTYVRKGVALACFYFARCLHRGLGIKKNPSEASKYYSRCFQFDPEVCAQFQDLVQNGQI